MIIDYLHRAPEFPIICVLDDWLVTARSAETFQRQINESSLTLAANYSMVDATGEDWVFHSDEMYVMPSMRRKWSKKKIIQTYNQSRNCARNGVTYSQKSLSNKRFETVFADIVELIEQTR
jgi:hypothetical protein